MPSRSVIDLMVQRSAFDLFAALGVSIAPTPEAVPQGRLAPDDLIGVIQLTVNGKRGSLSICVPPRTLERSKGQPARESSTIDTVRELANQLAGRLRNKLARYQVTVDMGLPNVFPRSSFHPAKQEGPPGIVYVFRTMTEDIRIELSRHFAELDLRYNGSIDIAEEGDVILF